MKTPALLFALCILACACKGKRETQASAVAPERLDYDSLYQSYGVEGCFALYSLSRDSLMLYNSRRAEAGFLPASTFKIPNSLIALETGVLKGPEDTIYWDGTERWNDNWNRDNTFRQAFHFSCVPCYQQIARRVGVGTMQHWTNAAQYGKLDIGPGNLDMFWLEGNSRITPMEQLSFLRRLYREELPFKIEHQRTVKDIMLMEDKPAYKLYGKTGWAQPDGRNIGWFVGFLETPAGAWVFVNNVENQQQPDGQNKRFQECRREIALSILQAELGIDWH